MNMPGLLIVLGILLALIDLFRSRGENLTAWAVVAIGVALTWGNLK